MRFLIPAAALALLAAPAMAQTTTTTPAAPAAPAAPATPDTTTAAPAPATPAASAPAHKRKVGHRISLKQRFDAANTSHDGQLTQDQATAAKWSYVTRHFAAMDTAHKGYVTMDDIHAYARAQHATRVKHTPKPAAAPATTPAQPSNS
jgi:hypothetical protein